MSDDPSKKTTLGGVPKQQFRPNLAASRNKKAAGANTAFDRLLQAEEPAIAPGARQPRMTRVDGTTIQPRVERPGGKSGAGGGTSGGASSSGAGSSSGGAAPARPTFGSSVGWTADADVKMDVDDEMSVQDRALTDAASEHSNSKWLLDSDAPLALPLRPFADGYRGANGHISRAASRGPVSRPVSRMSVGSAATDASNESAIMGYPPGSAAAAIFRGAQAAADEAAKLAGPDEAMGLADLPEPPAPLYLFQLPPILPLKAALADAEGANAMSGSEYLAALAGSASGGGGFGGAFSGPQSNAASVSGGGPIGGDGDKAPQTAAMSLAQLGEGQLGELIIYRSGRVALQIGEHKLDVQPGTVNSCEQEIVSMSMPETPGGPVDLHRLGKMHERLVVTPNVDHLLTGK